ncbi:MAG: imidazole glycerol phosphate synthase subunit HisH [Anaerolineae bacterium]|nr:imidazole glycerol phosphate synthase subunit HisH [Anaerolineae bacterium]
MIAIVDYGMGNLHSVQKAVERVGGQARVVETAQAIEAAAGVILPGVGAFGDAMGQLRRRGLVEPLRRRMAAGRSTLGICLGLQLLFEQSTEMGRHSGLGVLAGRVVRLPATCGRVPHVGWNQLHHCRDSALLAGIPEGGYAYFVHSYYAIPADAQVVLATTDYGLDCPAAVGVGAVLGVQFHPEKSQALGLRVLRNFVASATGRER